MYIFATCSFRGKEKSSLLRNLKTNDDDDDDGNQASGITTSTMRMVDIT